jgi:hypothetical protein
MKLPNKINTLQKLDKWVGINHPKTIKIGTKSLLNRILEFSIQEWETFNGIPLIYERKLKSFYWSSVMFQMPKKPKGITTRFNFRINPHDGNYITITNDAQIDWIEVHFKKPKHCDTTTNR